jgi:outer membrane protein OmpA-like peptidoglycan-associated protein
MLSQRRAEAIRAALARDGVSPSQVEIAAAGEVQPLAPVAGGPVEARNTRAQITF